MPILPTIQHHRHTAATRRKSAPRGQVHHVRREDREDEWPGSLTPLRVRNAIIQAIDGDPEQFIEIYRWCLRFDMVLRGAVEDRLFSLSGLEWDIVPATDLPGNEEEDKSAANDVASMVRSQLAKARWFEPFLEHNADGLLYGVAVSELIWEPDGRGHKLADIVPVPHQGVFSNRIGPDYDVRQLRVAVEEFDHTGEPIEDHPNKFIVHCPRQLGPSPWGGGIAMSTAIPAIHKKYGWEWFMSFVEQYGIPFRWGTYPASSQSENNSKLETALKELGSSGYAGLPENYTIQLLESTKGRGGTVHPELLELVNRWYHMYILGGELTASTGPVGAERGNAEVHERVSARLRRFDQRREAVTVRDQLLRPMVELSKMPTAPVPYFFRRQEEAKDAIQEAAKLEAAQRIGLTFTRGFAYDALDIAPPPDDENLDEVLTAPVSSPASPFGNLFGGR